jgi:protein involved in polysaccharide export with SLBB domain
MRLRAFLFGACLVVLGMAAAGSAAPQTYTPTGPPSYAPAEKVGLPEIRNLLLASNVPPETIERLLEAYPEDRTFTAEEARVLVESAVAISGVPERGEGASVRRPTGYPVGREGIRPLPETEPLPAGTRPTLGELPIFGQNIFLVAPEGFEPPQDVAVGPEYVLGAGDELAIVLWGTVEKQWTPLVSRDGNVALPQVGLIPAAGLSLAEFRETLRARLAAVYSGFELSVSLTTLRSIQVSVLGEVRRPGTYTLSPLSTSFNALYYAGGPTEIGTLRGVKVFRGDTLISVVDLYDLLLSGESGDDVRLGTDYRVFVPPVFGRVSVRGDVRRPARYEVKPGETVDDLVRFAGGTTATSYTPRQVLDRVRSDGTRETFDLALDAAGGATAVLDGDALTIYSVYQVEPRQYVTISGEVQAPGRYELFPGMTVSDLVFRAGNPIESAFLSGGELSRLAPSEGDSVAYTIPFSLESAISAPHGASDFALQAEDRVHIRRAPGWVPQATVTVTGEVRFPGAYSLTLREERLSQVMHRAGGLNAEAFPSASGLFRKEGGRIIVDFARVLSNPGSIEDVIMADGDSVYVPRYNETIQVTGAVSRPGALIYRPGKTADYYLRRTGGLREDADKGRVHIIGVDGSAQKVRRSMWFDPEVPPGAIIEVGSKAPGKATDWLGAIRDGATIMSGLATTIYIITQLNK